MIYFEGSRPMESFVGSVRSLVRNPAAFMEGLPGTAFYRDAIFFASVIVFLAAILSTPFHGMTWLFLLPVAWGGWLLGLLVWSAYARMMLGATTGRRPAASTLYSMAAYAGTPMALAFVPYLCWAGVLAHLALLFVGLRRRFKATNAQAALIVAIPALALAAIGVAALAAISHVRFTGG